MCIYPHGSRIFMIAHALIPLSLAARLTTMSLHNTGKSALPDMHSTQGYTMPECTYIQQSMSACVITNMLHFDSAL